uniref:RNA polymerase subunit beta' n=1 Tax=Prototheca lentecrescens TaxID=2836214 RepID=UPI0030035E68
MDIKLNREFTKIKIGLTAPREIQEWGERSLGNGSFIGEVTNSKTVNIKTLKPEIGGLFCQKIFGPIESNTCACERKKKSRSLEKFCPICEVERINSRVRRSRFGHILLKYPILHSFYVSLKPSPLTFFLDWSNIRLTNVISAVEFCFIDFDFFNFSSGSSIFNKIQSQNSSFFDKKQDSNLMTHPFIPNIAKKLPYLDDFDFLKQKEKLNQIINSYLKIGQYYGNLPNPEDSLLYGINYDLTWDKIEKLKNFLDFIWRKPNTTEFIIPYYAFSKKIKNYNKPFQIRQNSIHFSSSDHDMSDMFPIQTSGAAIERILAHYEAQNMIKQIEYELNITKKIYNKLKDYLNSLESSSLISENDIEIESIKKSSFFNKEEEQKDENIMIKFYSNLNETEQKQKEDSLEKNSTDSDFLNINDVYYEDKDDNMDIDGEGFSSVLEQNSSTKLVDDVDFVADTDEDVIVKEFQQKIDLIEPNNIKKENEREFKDDIGKDLIKIIKKNLILLKQLRSYSIRKSYYFRKIYLNQMQPAWMVLSCLPVLPPDLRPMTKIDDQVFTSDTTKLYQNVIVSNNRFIAQEKKSYNLYDSLLPIKWDLFRYNIQGLQDSVNSLLETGESEYSLESKNEIKVTKSLVDLLKGKKGRFRQHLLGKRVDYSGRSVIVVGPSLKIYECGLPLNMALELFQPYIIQKLMQLDIKMTTLEAKIFIIENKTKIWDFLNEIIRGHPLILNRAPTLHRLGIQAFFPKLILEKAIRLHPLVCSGFNADFDGDQMAVHVPLTFSAQSETLHLIWSRNNILSPASGQPIILPAQDMVLGCFFLTSAAPLKNPYLLAHNINQYNFLIKKKEKISLFFSSFYKIYYNNSQEIQRLVENNKILIHKPVWLQWTKSYQNGIKKKQAFIEEYPLEYQIDFYGNIIFVKVDRYQIITKTKKYKFIRTTPGRLLFYDLI